VPQVIDLTQEIYQGMPVHPRHMPTYIFPNLTREEYIARVGYPFMTRNLCINEHGPTHTDAIAEYVPEGPTIEKMALEYFMGSAICLDLRMVPPDGFIEPHDLERALSHSALRIEPRHRVLLCTGHFRRTHPGPEYLTRYAGLSRASAEWLADRGAINIGVDAPSIDSPKVTEFSGHRVCAERMITNTENLCNLEELINRSFHYIGLPLRLRDGTGSPIRAIAIIED